MDLDNKVNADCSFSIFAFLWAAATVFHMAKWSYWLASYNDFVLSIASFLVILKPSSLLRFSILIILQIWESVEQMPWISNHWLFTTLVNITILLSLGHIILSTKSMKINRSQ